MNASVVVGQADFTSRVLTVTANGPLTAQGAATDGRKLLIESALDHRILVWNSIPTVNGAAADVVICQQDFTSNSANQGGSVGANTCSTPRRLVIAGSKLIVADSGNSRVLIFNSIPTSNNASADVVIGQQNLTSGSANQGGSVRANTLNLPFAVAYDPVTGKLFIGDEGNSRVLIFNSIPTSNNASADVVVGQQNFTSSSADQGGSVGANTLQNPTDLYYDGKRLFISDSLNRRVLVYYGIPTSNNASANLVIGQLNFTSDSVNQGGNAGINTLSNTDAITVYNNQLFVGDYNNRRLLIFLQHPFLLRL